MRCALPHAPVQDGVRVSGQVRAALKRQDRVCAAGFPLPPARTTQELLTGVAYGRQVLQQHRRDGCNTAGTWTPPSNSDEGTSAWHHPPGS